MNVNEWYLSNEIDKTQKEINQLSEKHGSIDLDYAYGFEIGQLQGRLNTLIQLYEMMTGQK